jgi:hypothetical protein
VVKSGQKWSKPSKKLSDYQLTIQSGNIFYLLDCGPKRRGRLKKVGPFTVRDRFLLVAAASSGTSLPFAFTFLPWRS